MRACGPTASLRSQSTVQNESISIVSSLPPLRETLQLVDLKVDSSVRNAPQMTVTRVGLENIKRDFKRRVTDFHYRYRVGSGLFSPVPRNRPRRGFPCRSELRLSLSSSARTAGRRNANELPPSAAAKPNGPKPSARPMLSRWLRSRPRARPAWLTSRISRRLNRLYSLCCCDAVWFGTCSHPGKKDFL